MSRLTRLTGTTILGTADDSLRSPGTETTGAGYVDVPVQVYDPSSLQTLKSLVGQGVPQDSSYGAAKEGHALRKNCEAVQRDLRGKVEPAGAPVPRHLVPFRRSNGTRRSRGQLPHLHRAPSAPLKRFAGPGSSAPGTRPWTGRNQRSTSPSTRPQGLSEIRHLPAPSSEPPLSKLLFNL